MGATGTISQSDLATSNENSGTKPVRMPIKPGAMPASMHGCVRSRARNVRALPSAGSFLERWRKLLAVIWTSKNYLRVTDKGQSVLQMTENSMNALLERWVTIQTHFKGSKYVRGVPEPDRGVIMYEKARLANEDNIWNTFRTPVKPGSKPTAKLNAQGKSPQFERAHSCLRKSKAIIGLLCEAIDTKTVFVIATLHQFFAEALTTVVFHGEVATAYDMSGKDSLGRWAVGADFCHFNQDAVRKLGGVHEQPSTFGMITAVPWHLITSRPVSSHTRARKIIQAVQKMCARPINWTPTSTK
ncbi:hypothetical protein EPUS_09380 [Endocarpon pusillum Z07020]|uniref:Uncharacterized protein n=1 Tax=Endocarpon pusillum (strain Z07020 / HMAS-L-300199) TaxID=1263415 RepID=U1HDX8_ENDPU|nr:uncharacterized protein EPUS_09380 [Endocarpon pusillum Z07020]ERF68235.1 hypothetical protein EPUS_09380 [Endocarpon pusillum Z07020]